MKASVIMSVYNTEEAFLRECIDSILNQSEPDFEFVIIDDNSNADTKAVLASYDDNRIILIHNEENKGLTYNLNVALGISKGQYVVRMDADDVAYPDRIAKMTRYMDENCEINVLGSFMDCGGNIRKYYGNISWEIRNALLLFDNAGLGHPSVVFRKSFLDKYHLNYDTTIKKSQDYELWTRCMEYANLNVYEECLMMYRIHKNQISTKDSSEQNHYMRMVKERQLSKFKPFLSEEEISMFSLGDRHSKLSLFEYRKICKKILRANKKYGIAKQDILWYALRKKYTEYLNYHYINLYRIEKYLVVPLSSVIKKYTSIIAKEDENYSYLPK